MKLFIYKHITMHQYNINYHYMNYVENIKLYIPVRNNLNEIMEVLGSSVYQYAKCYNH